MFFIVNKQMPAGSMATVHGPFATKEEAVQLVERFTFTGDYVVYGPANAVHAVKVSAPVVESTPIGA